MSMSKKTDWKRRKHFVAGYARSRLKSASKPQSTVVIGLRDGAAKQKVPSELGQWSLRSSLFLAQERHLLDAIVSRPGEDLRIV